MWKEGLAIKIRSSWKVFIPLFFLLVFSFYLGAREFWRWFQINGEYSNIKKDIALAESKTEEIKNDLQNLKNPEFLEKEARGKLNLKKDGEYVLVVVGGDNFPKESFLPSEQQSASAISALKEKLMKWFDKQDDIWFNLKKWRDYMFPYYK